MKIKAGNLHRLWNVVMKTRNLYGSRQTASLTQLTYIHKINRGADGPRQARERTVVSQVFNLESHINNYFVLEIFFRTFYGGTQR